MVREVALTPKVSTEGKGLLGCDVAFGYFNKIPLREKDIKIQKEKEGMLGILGQLTGDSNSSPSTENMAQRPVIIRDPQNRKKNGPVLEDSLHLYPS